MPLAIIKLINEAIKAAIMKKSLFIVMCILLIPSAYADWFYNSEKIVVDMDIYSYAGIIKTSPGGYIESATVNLTFFPKNTETQDVLNYETLPSAEASDETITFRWKRPEERITYRWNGRIEITNKIAKISDKIRFPIEELPDDVLVYTKPSKTIDSENADIIRLASETVKGEDDLFAAVFKVADWTKHNIKYDLSTLTADVSQKASWVLQNRYGVCDELTSLFIAMLRSVGVPARFVSGIAYTNSELFPEKWGPHGWAEVYFPDYGWIPFDVTYGEFGWVDPTHIKFKDSVDPDESSTYFQWLGKNADLETRDLDIKTTLVGSYGNAKTDLSINADVFKNSVNFGSYNLIEATIRNNGNYYYATELYLNKPAELKIIGQESKSILLLPNENRKVYWILKVDEGLSSKYSYTFPIAVSTTNNLTAKTSFEADARQSSVSHDEVQQAALLLEEETEKKYSGNVVLECAISEKEFYADESAGIECNAKNTGNVFLDNLKACFQSKCVDFNLGISQEKLFSFKADNLDTGLKEIPVILRNNLVSKSSYLSFQVKDRPKVNIEEIQYPVNASFNGNITISFVIVQSSQSNPKKVEVTLKQDNIDKKWLIPELEGSRKFIVSIEGSRMRYGKNNYEISANYEDDSGKKYSASERFEIQLTDANLLQRASLSLNNFEFLSAEEIGLILLSGTVGFLIVVGVILRKNRKVRER